MKISSIKLFAQQQICALHDARKNSRSQMLMEKMVVPTSLFLIQ